MNTTTIEQELTFEAKPHTIFEILMDSKKHSELTGQDAEISREVGGKISIFDEWVEGENLEIEDDEKIVQSWRASEEGWPKEHFSTVTFELEENAEGNTILRFKHELVPADLADDFKQGWEDNYWNPLQDMLKS